MADTDRITHRPHPSRDLRQPAMQDLLGERLAHMRDAGKLPALGAPPAGHVMCRHAMIAVELWPFLVDNASRFSVERWHPGARAII